ncbi:EamA family transporter [Flavobacterium cyanobacteriorum]|uniref:EamA family transporter n=1 Tax=Flavobacterium cyanobacteriorum TaxID=2022802 RepID=A0A255ZRZ7_9FLAO|nr:EamA family transporter [Flavobacterium cyanobacteriorum]OYQ43694.1 EamA family transporter [Flavobacterium cyanobacteriorum]
MRISKHYLAGVTAFVIWGFFSLGLRPLRQYPSLDILFFRILFCVVLMLLLSLAFRRKALKEATAHYRQLTKSARAKLIAAVVASGFLLTANWFLFIYVMNHVSVKSASFAYLVCPILTTVLAFFILKEKLTRLQWIAVSISAAGCVLLSFNGLLDIFYSLVVAFTYALYLIIQKKITGIDKFLLLTVQVGIISLIMLPFLPAYGSPVPQETFFYFFILLIAILFTIIPLFLNLYALKTIKSSTVGMLLYINPVIGFLLSAFYFNEVISALQVTGYTLIVISILLFNRNAFKQL